MDILIELEEELFSLLDDTDLSFISLTCKKYRHRYKILSNEDKIEWVTKYRGIYSILKLQDENINDILLDHVVKNLRWEALYIMLNYDINEKSAWQYDSSELLFILLKYIAPIEVIINLLDKDLLSIPGLLLDELGTYGRVDILVEFYKKYPQTISAYNWHNLINSFIFSIIIVDWNKLYTINPIVNCIDRGKDYIKFTCGYNENPIKMTNLIGFLKLFTPKKADHILGHNLMHCGCTSSDLVEMIWNEPHSLAIFIKEFKMFPEMNWSKNPLNISDPIIQQTVDYIEKWDSSLNVLYIRYISLWSKSQMERKLDWLVNKATFEQKEVFIDIIKDAMIKYL